MMARTERLSKKGAGDAVNEIQEKDGRLLYPDEDLFFVGDYISDEILGFRKFAGRQYSSRLGLQAYRYTLGWKCPRCPARDLVISITKLETDWLWLFRLLSTLRLEVEGLKGASPTINPLLDNAIKAYVVYRTASDACNL